jgi:hypothetical protein
MAVHSFSSPLTCRHPDAPEAELQFLLCGPDGHLPLLQKVLANGGAFLLLAADVPSPRRARSGTAVLAPGKSSTSMPGWSVTLDPGPSSDPTCAR